MDNNSNDSNDNIKQTIIEYNCTNNCIWNVDAAVEYATAPAAAAAAAAAVTDDDDDNVHVC